MRLSSGTLTRANLRHTLSLESGLENEVVAYDGTERLGQVYRFSVYFLVENTVEVDLGELIGQRARVGTDGDFESFVVHGVVASAELSDVNSGVSVYRVELVPEIWRSALSRHTRVFVDVSVKDVLSKMFEILGFSSQQVRLGFSAEPLRKYPQICQFEESDLDFMTRWMEKEGLHYYFEQGRDEECLVVVSGQPAQQELHHAPITYSTGASTHHSISRLAPRSRLQTQKFEVRGYDPGRPATLAEATEELDGQRAGAGVSVALSTEIASPEVSKEAKLLKEIQGAERVVFSGEADMPVFRSGYHFRVEGHPLPRLDAEYYVTMVRHQAVQPVADMPAITQLLGLEASHTTYKCSFECVRGDVVYRLQRTTPLPRIYGTLSGVVDGAEDSDYAQLDDAGRYRVRLRFDEQEKGDGAASMWVRMLQNHAGNPEGIHYPLRKGTEVMLVFLGGDPDQPLIVGAVPNALTSSPITQSNQSKNILHTAGDNHFELEDQRGKQHRAEDTNGDHSAIHGSAAHPRGKPYNPVQLTDGDGRLRTGRNYDVKVEGAHDELIVGAVTQTYRDVRTTNVTGNVTELYQAKQTTTVMEDVTWECVGDYDGHSHGDYTLVVDGEYSVDYEESAVETFHGATSSSYMGALNENFFGVVNSNALAAVNENFAGLVLTTYVAGYININLATGLDVNVALPTELNVAGSLTCDFALSASLFVGGTLDIRLAADITLAMVSMSVTLMDASETILSFSHNTIEASGKSIDLMKSDTQVNTTSASVTP
ncbi:MAG: type VI secretion system tip protein TssI/VgrG [Polyangiaceae bacterium]